MKHHFTATDVALTSVFCAMYAVLNITLAPLSMAWFGLPVLCDFAVFFTLFLAVWATGRFGVASLVGIVGSPMTLLRGNNVNLGFAPAAVLFDFLLLLTRHKLEAKPYSLAVGALATAVSAYFAGVVIAVLFLNRSLDWAVTFWGVWHLIGGVIAIAVTLPVVSILEKTNVKAIRNGGKRH